MLRALILLLLVTGYSYSQESKLIFPKGQEWRNIEEGDTIDFNLGLTASNVSTHYNILYDDELNIQFDSTGRFQWVPSYNLVERVEDHKTIPVIFEAYDSAGLSARETVEFEISHKNRKPTIDNLPVFYVKQYSENQFNLNQLDQIQDPDDDPIVFIPKLSELPEGASLSEIGVFSWKPSRNQFRKLKKESVVVSFAVQDQPEKSETIGTFTISPTQLDLPPDILIVPYDSVLKVKEDEVLNLKFYVSDPNGDDNIRDVGFVSNNLSVPKSALKKNTATQWEFIWTPGYDFVQEKGTETTVQMTFFVVDDSDKKVDKGLSVVVIDTENIVERDKRLYQKYKQTLIMAMDRVAELDDNQRRLNKELRKAKKGKKSRSIVNASLGAITGVSPVFIQDETSKNYVTGVGGTAVLTLGTLEATEVIGRSKNDILERLKTNIDMRNQIQSQADQFARQYSLKSRRRDKAFFTDIDKLKAELNNKKLILLELPADWENPKKPTEENIRKTFPDFQIERF